VGVKLYVIPGSHPSLSVRLMLERKGIEYERVDLIPALHKPQLRALRFPGATVPALRLDGERVQGSRNISRRLESLRPEPPLFPPDPERRAAVEEAERWGDEVLQPVPRRVCWWAIRRDHAAAAGFLEGARLPVPDAVAVRTTRPIAWIAAWGNGATDAAVQADLAALPGLLDRVDELIGESVLCGPDPNAADYQIATSVRLLMCLDDLRPAIEDRPAAALAHRVVPSFPGRVGPIFPAEWLAPLRSAAAA
jgi:glutathione S-transferase